MTLTEYRYIAQTGDMFGFIGHGGLARVIRAVAPPFSHVGMVFKIPTFDQGDVVLLWESTTLNAAGDWFHGKVRKGVQTTSLTDKCATYNGEFFVRRLLRPLTQTQLATLYAARADWKGQYDMVGTLGTLLPWCLQGKENIRRMFCSELIAHALKDINVLRRDRPSDTYTPSDLMQYGDVPGLEAFYGRKEEVTL